MPVATTENVTLVAELAVVAAGWVVMAGAVAAGLEPEPGLEPPPPEPLLPEPLPEAAVTVRVADSETALPAELETTSR